MDGVQVPHEYVNGGQIVLNINPSSVRHLTMDHEGVSFDARFNGKSHTLFAPIKAISAIYAKENGQGMVFEVEPDTGPGAPTEPSGPQRSKKKSDAEKAPKTESTRPQLKVVK